jgi:type I restriction enzyme S subunit
MRMMNPETPYRKVHVEMQQTEFGALPVDWSVVPLISLADRIMVGIASAATHAYRSSGVTMFRNQNIKPGVLDIQDVLYIDSQYEQTYKNKRLKAGDLLTARTGYPGTTSLVPEGFDGSQSFTTLITRPRSGSVDPRYLCLYINGASGQRYFEQTQIGGGQKNVNAASLKLLPVALPNTDLEQRAIADALTDADGLIDSLAQLLTKKRHIRRGAMQELLTGKRRLPGFDQPWESMRLGDIATITMGRTPARLTSSYWGSGYKWLSIADLKGKVVLGSKEEITETGAHGMNIVPKGTLLMSFKLTIGRLAFAGCDLYTNEAICALRDPTVDKGALYYALSRVDFSLFGKQAVKGYTLNKESLRAVEVRLPTDPDEQRALAEVLSSLDSDMTALESRLTKARALKHAMAQALLTGRIRLPLEGGVGGVALSPFDEICTLGTGQVHT